MKKTVKTNEEFLEELMMFSEHGALIRIFIIEAIRNYAEEVAANPVPKEDGNSFISQIAWHGCATEILARMKENYERK